MESRIIKVLPYLEACISLCDVVSVVALLRLCFNLNVIIVTWIAYCKASW